MRSVASRLPRRLTACSRAALPPSLSIHRVSAWRRDAARPLTSSSCTSSISPDNCANGGGSLQPAASAPSRAANSSAAWEGGRRAIAQAWHGAATARRIGRVQAAAARLGRLPPPLSSPMSAIGTFGTPLTPRAIRVLLLGAGELGKEVAIELQRFGVEVVRSEEHTSELQSLMRISYAVFCLKKKKNTIKC